MDIRPKPRVVVDTNSVNNFGLGNMLFGMRKELENIIDKIDLYVPSIVVEEIKEHKRKSFFKQRNEFGRSDFMKILGINRALLDTTNVNEIIESDLNSEDIPYTLLTIDNYEKFLSKFERRLIRNEPPFDKESDKGIKDAMIAYSVEKLLSEIRLEEKIILVCNDGRLKEYFEDNERVRTTDSIKGIADLIEHDRGLPIDTDGKIEISFAGIREKTETEKKIDKMLTNLRNSINFQKTHEFISALKKNVSLLTKENKTDIIRSSINNSQIRWIIKDQDVYEFLIPIFIDCYALLTEEEKAEFKAIAEINF